MRTCPICRKRFAPAAPHQVYCTPACRVKAFRRRRSGRASTKTGHPTGRPGRKPAKPKSREGTVAALEDGVLLLQSFARAIPDIALIIDEDGRYVEVLAAPEREDLLYKEAAALKGRTLHEVLPKGRADLFLSVVRKTIESREPQTLEYSLDVQAGKLWFEGRSAPLDFPSKKRLAVWVAHDITERKRAERARRIARNRLASRLEAVADRPDPYGMSIREHAVLELLAEGKPDREIATILDVSKRTVSKHVENILTKMGARSRTEAGVRAVRDGLVD